MKDRFRFPVFRFPFPEKSKPPESCGVRVHPHIAQEAEARDVWGTLLLGGCASVWATRPSFIMFLYLGAVSVMLHNFWTITNEMSRGGMQTQFMKNVAIMGGLLMISAYGAGRWAADGRSR